MVGYIGEPTSTMGMVPVVDGRPLFYGLSDERNGLRLPAYSRLDVRADRAFNWSGRRLVLFVDVANIANRRTCATSALRGSRRPRLRDH